MTISIGRRELITALGGAAIWPLAGRAQQALPVVGFLSGNTADAVTPELAAFRKGLGETGYVEGQNVTVEYHWLEGHYDRLPALVADLVRRQVAVIAAPGSDPDAIAAKSATTTIPIVFGVAQDPVEMGLVASLARPGGNATGVNFFNHEVDAKRLGIMHDLLSRAHRFAVLLNPANTRAADATQKSLKDAARALGVEVQFLNASSPTEIDAAFVAVGRDQIDALFVAGDGFFNSRRVQLATLAMGKRVPASGAGSQFVEAGLLMSYGTNLADTFHQVGVYTGNILKGAKPADLPVLQSTKFEFAINLQAARALGIEVPPAVLSIADEVIE